MPRDSVIGRASRLHESFEKDDVHSADGAGFTTSVPIGPEKRVQRLSGRCNEISHARRFGARVDEPGRTGNEGVARGTAGCT